MVFRRGGMEKARVWIGCRPVFHICHVARFPFISFVVPVPVPVVFPFPFFSPCLRFLCNCNPSPRWMVFLHLIPVMISSRLPMLYLMPNRLPRLPPWEPPASALGPADLQSSGEDVLRLQAHARPILCSDQVETVDSCPTIGEFAR